MHGLSYDQTCTAKLSYQLFSSLLKGAVSATPLFLFTSGNDKLNCLKEAPKIYPSTKRNSQADCRIVSEARKQLMPWMETNCSKHTYFRWKIKWWLEHLGVLGTMCEMAPLNCAYTCRNLTERVAQYIKVLRMQSLEYMYAVAFSAQTL